MEKKNLRRGRDGIRNSDSRSPCKKFVAEATSFSPIQVLSAPFFIGPYYHAQLIPRLKLSCEGLALSMISLRRDRLLVLMGSGVSVVSSINYRLYNIVAEVRFRVSRLFLQLEFR